MFTNFGNKYLIKIHLVWMLLLLFLFLNACGQQKLAQVTETEEVTNSDVDQKPLVDQESSTEILSTSIIPPTQQDMQSLRRDSVVAFVSDRRERNNLDIWIIDTETGQLEALTSDDSQDWNPLWSPDGEKLAYLSAKNKEDVYVIVLDFQSREVVDQLYRPDIWNISWSSDSVNLWLDTYSGIWHYNIIEESVTKPFSNNDGGPVSESYDGTFIAIGIQENENSNAYSLQILNSENDNIPIQYRDNLLNLSVSGITWDHTTNRLITTFQTASSHVAGRISILAFSETHFEELVAESSKEMSLDYCHPAWSPSDDYLSYVVVWSYAEVPCLGDVYIAKDDFSQTFHISDNSTITQQPWSPAGTQVVYSQNAKSPWWAPSRSFGFPGEGSIWISNYNGNEKRKLTDGDWYDGEAVWRP